MPKLKLTDAQKMDIAVRQAVARYTTETKSPHDVLSKAMGIARSTYFVRLKEPGDMTLDELRGLCRKLPITPEEIVRMVKS